MGTGNFIKKSTPGQPDEFIQGEGNSSLLKKKKKKDPGRMNYSCWF